MLTITGQSAIADELSIHITSLTFCRLMPDLPEVLASCDYVCNILPSTPETKGTLGGDKFRHCANKVKSLA